MVSCKTAFDRQHRTRTIGTIFIVFIASVAIGSIIYAAIDIASGDESTPEGPDDYIRLPTSVRPISYVIRLQPFIEGNYSIDGSTEIAFEVVEKTWNVTLHMAYITHYEETVQITEGDDGKGSVVPVNYMTYYDDQNILVIKFDSSLAAGNRYTLSMSFMSSMTDQMYGFYISPYSDGDEDKVLGVTQFEPTDARRVFPCFDEPAMKATFEIFLARHPSKISISNMPLLETTPFDDDPDWVWDHFNTSLPMSSYLVAFAISDFKSVESNYNDHVVFKVWARESAIDQVEYASSAAPAILTRYEEYFNISFPLPKQDMIAVPDMSARAMENWGLITFLETFLLYENTTCSELNKERTLATIAHELAHQWFGDLVTMEWWSDVWLNEGFASYVKYIGTDSYEPSWGYKDEFVLQDLHVALSLDCLEASHPLSVHVLRTEEIYQLFDTISYSKGASILRMLNHTLGENTFRKGVTNYLNEHKYANANQDDLWSSLTDQAHEDGKLTDNQSVKTIMDTWTLQQGYPVLEVIVNDDGTAILSQDRFLMWINPNSTDTHDYSWWIPLPMVTEENPDFDETETTLWMTAEISSLILDKLPPGWVLINPQQTGYYRVNYDIDSWLRFQDQLEVDHEVIHRVSRAQLIDDSMYLARAGLLTYDIALEINSYLGNEEEYVPWQAALTNLRYLEEMFTRTGSYGLLQEYLLSLVTPLFEHLGFSDDPSAPHQELLLHVLALRWACKLGVDECVDGSVGLFAQWMDEPNNETIISPNVRATVYCTAIAAGDQDQWDFLWSRYHEAHTAQEQERILVALGCSPTLWVLAGYLEMAFDPSSGIRPKDARIVFAAVAANDIGRDLAWEYLQGHLYDITEYLQTLQVVGTMVLEATDEFNTREKLQELIQFTEDNEQYLETATLAVAQSIEKTQINIYWMETYFDDVVGWLSNTTMI